MQNEREISQDMYTPYLNKKNAAGTAMNMIRFAISNYNQCILLKNLDYLESTLSKRLGQLEIEKIGEIAFNKPVDFFRIVLCFENYCKAVLLVNSILINKMELSNAPQELKKLDKKQRNHPILFSEFQKYSNWKQRSNGTLYVDFLRKETLSFSTILKDAYNEIIQLPLEIRDFLIEVNKERNLIHYFPYLSFSNSRLFINNVRNLSLFVNTDMVKYSDDLILKNSNIPNRHLINEFKRKIMDV